MNSLTPFARRKKIAEVPAEPPADDDHGLAAVKAKAADLRARRAVVEAELLALRQRGVKEGDRPESTTAVRAQRLLGVESVPQPSGEQLTELREELAALLVALEMLEQQEQTAHRAIVADRVRDRMPEWRELTRDLAMAVLAVQRLNRATRDFARSLRSGGMVPSLPGAMQPALLLGTGESNDGPVYTFVSEIAKLGIVTRAEIEAAGGRCR